MAATATAIDFIKISSANTWTTLCQYLLPAEWRSEQQIFSSTLVDVDGWGLYLQRPTARQTIAELLNRPTRIKFPAERFNNCEHKEYYMININNSDFC